MTLAIYTPARRPRVYFDAEIGQYERSDFGDLMLPEPTAEPASAESFIAKTALAVGDLAILATECASLVLLAMVARVLIGAVRWL